MSPSESSLVFELQKLIDEVRSAQSAFSDAQVRATALIEELSAGGGDSAQAQNAHHIGLEDSFDSNGDFERLLQQEFARATSKGDHYVEKPFVDPYDCFEDSEPEHGFPFPDRLARQGALQGLFESAPRVSGGGRESTGADVEIEYLPNGGYRMSSRPRSKAYREVDSMSPDDLDDLDGLAS